MLRFYVTSMKHTARIIALLKKEYKIKFFKDRNPFRVLIGCLLSLRTKDEVSYPATDRLFRLAKTPKEMLKLDIKQIEKIIYPVGFYKTKAKRIKEISKTLIKRYNSKVPSILEELLKLKGIGRKCSGIVMCYAYKKVVSIPIDSHCHRVSNRIGLVKTRTPEQTEKELMKKLPKKYWLDFNELFVRHGQTICKPISPFCSKCKIRRYCRRIGVGRSR